MANLPHFTFSKGLVLIRNIYFLVHLFLMVSISKLLVLVISEVWIFVYNFSIPVIAPVKMFVFKVPKVKVIWYEVPPFCDRIEP